MPDGVEVPRGVMVLRTIAGAVDVLAPAKLNLFLEVRGKRADGYHEIETLLVAIDLHDRLVFRDDPSGRITLSCDDPRLPLGNDNLVVRAAQRLKDEAGCDRGATIELHKVIPAQAGLAGGSSDAAATLLALDRLWNLGLESSRIESIAGFIGSDVPFFLHTPAAVCRGRGEVVEPIDLAHPVHCVVVCPNVGVKTADAYQRVAAPEVPRPVEPVLRALAAGDGRDLGEKLFNRLQPASESLVPELVAVRQALESLRPSLLDGLLMSGSGSAYFGLARDRGAAELAARHLEPLGLGMVRVVTCGTSRPPSLA